MTLANNIYWMQTFQYGMNIAATKLLNTLVGMVKDPIDYKYWYIVFLHLLTGDRKYGKINQCRRNNFSINQRTLSTEGVLLCEEQRNQIQNTPNCIEIM